MTDFPSWVTAIAAVLALVIAGLAHRTSSEALRVARAAQDQTEQLHKEVNWPGWRVTVHKYVINLPSEVVINLECGTQWTLENVGRVSAHGVRITSAWVPDLHLDQADSRDLGVIAAGSQAAIVCIPDPESLPRSDTMYPDTDWPDIDSYVSELRHAKVQQGSVTVSWIGADGTSQSKCVPVFAPVANTEEGTRFTDALILNTLGAGDESQEAFVEWRTPDGQFRSSRVLRSHVRRDG